MKKLMILGASYSLIPLIKAGKRLGFHTIAASIPGDYPGFAEADESCYVDITDPEAVLKAAKELEIDGVATCCMDVGIKSLGYVNTHMDLCGPVFDTTSLCVNKYLMKEKFVKGNVNTAKFVKIESRDDLGPAMEALRFPVILKAVDQMGSRGIHRCDSKEEVYEFYDFTMAATKQPYCILEEFLIGEMFGVEAVVQNGKPVAIVAMGNVLHNGNPPFPVGHVVPWANGEKIEEKIMTQIELAIKAIGADNTPMDFDMMACEDGEVYIIEGTARCGATGIAELMSLHFGIDYYEAIAKCAMGISVSDMFAVEKDKRKPAITRILESFKEGTLEEIIMPESLPAGVLDYSYNVEPGDKLNLMTNGRDRIGQVILSADTVEQCLNDLDKIIEDTTLVIK